MDWSNTQEYIRKFCCEQQIDIITSTLMPQGYEDAFGTYDFLKNTLYLNIDLLSCVSDTETLFYLYHELRHALQYQKPHLFSEQLQKSLYYVILYNGICFKLTDKQWLECKLSGDEAYFSQAYLSLPYEIDANIFAYQEVKKITGDSCELNNLHRFWIPSSPLPYSELEDIFIRIDQAVL